MRMPRPLCQVAPFLVLFAALSGCSRSHDGRSSPDAGRSGDAGEVQYCECCGTTVAIGLDEDCALGICDPFCLFPPPDGGADAGPLRCGAHDIDLACDVDTVRAGAPTTISVVVGGDGSCYCGERIECRARVSGPGTLALETGLCADGPLCEACFPFVEGTCDLPALTPGTWRVTLNGRPGFELEALEAGVAPEWGETCTRLGDALSVCEPSWPPVPNVVDMACAQSDVLAGTRLGIDLTDSCASACDATGPCTVSIFDDVVRVTPSTWQPSCDIACPAVCELRMETCYTPPLPAGEWRVLVEGYDAPLFTVRATDFGGDPGEVLCGGAASGG